LGKVLGPLISEEQLAFVGDRNMLDGVLVLNEVVHEAKAKHMPIFIFKIDY